jgi:hypothetical protein
MEEQAFVVDDVNRTWGLAEQVPGTAAQHQQCCASARVPCLHEQGQRHPRCDVLPLLDRARAEMRGCKGAHPLAAVVTIGRTLAQVEKPGNGTVTLIIRPSRVRSRPPYLA